MKVEDFIFGRTAPKKKLELIKKLTESELLSVKEESVLRMVKDAGINRYKSRDKYLPVIGAGNSWNSKFEQVGTYRNKLHVELYIQYSNTDTTINDEYYNFFKRGEYRGVVYSSDRYGNPQTYYATYDESDKARCMREILKSYINRKYHDKLNPAK